MENSDTERISNWLKVIAEPTRLYLLEKIMNGAQCNCELGKERGLAPNLVSHHLSVLKESGLIKAEHDQEDARWIYYSVDPDVLAKIRQLISAFLSPDRIQARKINCRYREQS